MKEIGANYEHWLPLTFFFFPRFFSSFLFLTGMVSSLVYSIWAFGISLNISEIRQKDTEYSTSAFIGNKAQGMWIPVTFLVAVCSSAFHLITIPQGRRTVHTSHSLAEMTTQMASTVFVYLAYRERGDQPETHMFARLLLYLSCRKTVVLSIFPAITDYPEQRAIGCLNSIHQQRMGCHFPTSSLFCTQASLYLQIHHFRGKAEAVSDPK